MKPSLGRIVIHRGISSNGATEHPAMITRVWSDTCVNLTVFPDFGAPVLRTSQTLLTDPAQPQEGWFWPPRVEAGPSGLDGQLIGPARC